LVNCLKVRVTLVRLPNPSKAGIELKLEEDAMRQIILAMPLKI
jgi:hypothetical protein